MERGKWGDWKSFSIFTFPFSIPFVSDCKFRDKSQFCEVWGKKSELNYCVITGESARTYAIFCFFLSIYSVVLAKASRATAAITPIAAK